MTLPELEATVLGMDNGDWTITEQLYLRLVTFGGRTFCTPQVVRTVLAGENWVGDYPVHGPRTRAEVERATGEPVS